MTVKTRADGGVALSGNAVMLGYLGGDMHPESLGGILPMNLSIFDEPGVAKMGKALHDALKPSAPTWTFLSNGRNARVILDELEAEALLVFLPYVIKGWSGLESANEILGSAKALEKNLRTWDMDNAWVGESLR